MTNNHARARFVALAFGALIATSCAKGAGGPSSAAAADTSGVTATAAPPASVASTVVNVAAEPVARPEAPVATAPQIEAPAAAPAADVLRTVTAAQSKLAGIAAGVEGTRVRFVDCAAEARCTARLEAQTLAGLRDLLAAVSAQQGGVGFVAREQLDGYAGRTFAADVTWGGGDARAVPVNEADLLAN